MATLVLTVLGDDRAGLVETLAAAIAGQGGNWDESHMAELAGKFAGIVMVTVPDAKRDDLIAALQPLEAQGVFDITIDTADETPVAPSVNRFTLDLLGNDQPGIIHDISSALARLDVSIEELRTDTRSAPMAGGTLFEANAVLASPIDVDLDELTASLEELANELMVDISLEPTKET